MKNDHLVPIGEASRRVRCHPATLKNIERRGGLTSFRDSRNFRFYLNSEIEALCAQREPQRQEEHEKANK